MGMAELERRKDEKIDGVIYDMSPSPNYQHGIVNSNIHTIIKQGLKNSICLVSIENLDFKYHPDKNDDYLCPDIMIICDRKHLKGGAYSGTPKCMAGRPVPRGGLRPLHRQAGQGGEKGYLRKRRRGRILDCLSGGTSGNLLPERGQICPGRKLYPAK